MTNWPHLVEARIRDARKRGVFDSDDEEDKGPTAVPMEVVLMQQIEALKREIDAEEEAEALDEMRERLADLRRELSMYHERAGRYITASKL